MLALTSATRVFVVSGATDMRKGYNGLSAIVEHQLKTDPLSGHVFAFCNRRKDRIKLLVWDGSGLWVSGKRLERGTFAWPQNGQRSMEMSVEEVTLLLSGIDLKQTERRRWYQRRNIDRQKRKKPAPVLNSLDVTS